jgi:uracil-DNA glycosylase
MRQYLGQLQERGVTHVAVDREALGAMKRSATVLAVAPAPARPVATVAPKPKPETVTVQAPLAPMPAAPSASGNAERLAKVREKAANSAECRALGTFRDTMVFAVGDPDAELMFIGEAPGAEEEKQDEPFVGPAGQLLTRIIHAMGLKRSSVYISNICKFRPAIEGGQGSKNRPPSRAEMDACLPFITEEIEIIRPKAIMAVGATAANGLGIEGTVGRLRGSTFDFRGTPVFVTYHPSYLLRREVEDGGGLREKRLVWEDMLRVMEHMGLPISEKQRAYFTKAIG